MTNDLEIAVERYKASRILVLGGDQAALTFSPEKSLHHWPRNQQHPPTRETQYDLGIVQPEVFLAPPPRIIPTLAALRDLYARIIWVLFDADIADSKWQLSEFLALGFIHKKRYESPSHIHLFYYDIFDYKHTPDWFGPKNWANPEQWDKNHW